VTRAPGRFLPLACGRRHVQLAGAAAPGAPTVVLEAALGGSSLGWCFVQPALAAATRVLSYDRAGLGWSPMGPLPRDLAAQTAELAQVLEAAAPPPYVLVGHSYGALLVRRYAGLHPERVAGLVLVDPPAEGEWASPDAEHRARLAQGIRLARRGVWAARCGVAQLTAWLVGTGAFGLAAASARLVSGGRLRTARDFNFAPASRLPPALKPAMRRIWSRARFYATLAAQMETLPAAVRLAAAAPLPPALPLRVLSAADTPPAQLAEHRALARRSARGAHRQAARSGHWIPLEDPDLVAHAVDEVLAIARADPPAL
jgi:pimeloyl-ACP methyl ester carboxylesterase